MSSWSIRVSKKYTPISLVKEKFRIEDWQNIVDSDPELIWEENSKIALDFKAAGKEWISKDYFRQRAYFDIRGNKNWPGLRFNFFEGTITAMTERQTLKRVKKLWEISKILKGHLFKNGILFNEAKFEKYCMKKLDKGNITQND